MLDTLLIIFFVLGYLAIIFERKLEVNKSAVALVMAVVLWAIFFLKKGAVVSNVSCFVEQISDTSQVVFFLLAAMTIVELIDSHHGFKVVTDVLYTSSKRKMLWFILLVSFFMSSVLDNLTSMIVMISLLRKMVPEKEDRWLLGSLVVIAVNAGGAWTPIGDVTTTMLWINNRITTGSIIKMLFLPSILNLVVAGLLGSLLIKKDNGLRANPSLHHRPMETGAKRVLILGILSLIMIPVYKALFNLPPFMGALLGVGLLWIVTDIIHVRHGEARTHLRVPHILSKIDTPGILFFLGILLAVDALSVAGILKELAHTLERNLPTQELVAIFIGLVSSVVDNVPLVAATFGMYDLTTYPINSPFWQLVAYAAGTGGSILIIGSAAGVAFMGLEKVDFFWYLKKVSWIALISYFIGIGIYFLTYPLLS